MTPNYIATTKHHVIACSEQAVYVWQYRSSMSKLGIDTGTGGSNRKAGRETSFHIDVVCLPPLCCTVFVVVVVVVVSRSPT